ncbi:MAG: hypothetical protein AB8B69_13155 [Chitinophagales bacterium]
MARKARLKDYVEIKQGEKDIQTNTFDISGCKGFVTKVEETVPLSENRILEISWDIKTLDNLPDGFIEYAIANESSFSETNVYDNQVIVRPKPRRENKIKREEIIMDIKACNTPSRLDDHEERIVEILNTNDFEVSYERLETYRNFLLKELSEPVILTGIEDFPWEERFIFGFGDDDEYEELKKTNPSYTDTFQLIEILKPVRYSNDLRAKVKRESDEKVFHINLSNLEAIDNSSNYAILNDFSIWVVNY